MFKRIFNCNDSISTHPQIFIYTNIILNMLFLKYVTSVLSNSSLKTRDFTIEVIEIISKYLLNKCTRSLPGRFHGLFFICVSVVHICFSVCEIVDVVLQFHPVVYPVSWYMYSTLSFCDTSSSKVVVLVVSTAFWIIKYSKISIASKFSY